MRTNPTKTARDYLMGLTSLHLGRPVPDTEIEWLLARVPVLRWSIGDVVFQQGEPGEDAVLVVNGELTVTVSTPEGDRTVGRVGAWDVVGETALYAPEMPRSATVRATRETSGLRIGRALLSDARDNPVVAAIEHYLLHTLSQRIRLTNRAIEEAWRERAGIEEGPDRYTLNDLFGTEETKS